jgi:hypothetical protein
MREEPAPIVKSAVKARAGFSRPSGSYGFAGQHPPGRGGLPCRLQQIFYPFRSPRTGNPDYKPQGPLGRASAIGANAAHRRD